MSGSTDIAAASVDAWEAAYLRFETPTEEVAKFKRRLLRLGAASWPRERRFLELCCGRGNGLTALAELGFHRALGLDLSRRLLAGASHQGRVLQSDCRTLPLRTGSLDFVVVQGGLHHLQSLPDDLERTLEEAHRVLRDDGHLIVVEPWRTRFLDLVHFAASSRTLCRLSTKLADFSAMVEHERDTYERWLAAPRTITDLLERFFDPTQRETGWGKLCFVGAKRAGVVGRGTRG